MAKIQFLTILLTVTCFLGSVVSVTHKEFEVCSEHVQVVTLKMSINQIHHFGSDETKFGWKELLGTVITM